MAEERDQTSHVRTEIDSFTRSFLFTRTHPSCLPEESVTEWLLDIVDTRYSLTSAEIEGPGEVQGWKLLGGESACFALTEWQPPKPRKKVILSLAYLNLIIKDLMPNEIQLLSSLIEHFDVYLWQGQEIYIATAKPLSHIHDFFRLCSTMQPASARTIQDYLEKNHLVVDDYTIIDVMAYYNRWDRPLAARNFDTAEKLQVFLDSVDPQTTTLQLDGEFSPHILKKILDHFSQLNSLNLSAISSDRLKEVLSLCKGSTIKTVTLQNPIAEDPGFPLVSLSFSENYGLQRLIIEAFDKEVHASCDEQLEICVHSNIPCTIAGKSCVSSSSALYPSKTMNLPKTAFITSLLEYEELCASGKNKTLTSLSLSLDAEIFPRLNLPEDFPNLKNLGIVLSSRDPDTVPNVKLATQPLLEYLYLAPSSVIIHFEGQPKLLQLYCTTSEIDYRSFPELRYLFLLGHDGPPRRFIDRDLPELAEIKYQKHQPLPQVSLEPAFTDIEPSNLEDKKHHKPRAKSESSLFDTAPSVSSSSENSEELRYGEEKEVARDFGFYCLDDELIPHQPTGQPLLIDQRESSTPGRIRYSLRKGGPEAEPVKISDYLGQAYNRIQWDSSTDQLSFAKAQPAGGYKDISSNIQPLDQKPDTIAPAMHSGSAEGILQPGVFYPLMLSATSQDLTLYAAGDPKLELHQDSHHGHYYVRLPLGNPPTKVSLSYEFTPDENYTAKPEGEWTLEKHQLPPELQLRVAAELQTISELRFLLDPMLTLREKINQLISFFEGFAHDTNLAGSYAPKSLALMIATIKAKCGNCEERSLGFLLLSQWLGIDAQIRRNVQHTFIELRSQEGNLIHINLGGGSKTNVVRDAMTPVSAPSSPLISTPISTLAPTPAPKQNSYEEFIRKQLDEPEIFSWDVLTTPDTKSTKPRLIRLPEKQSIPELRTKYFSPKAIPGDYLFINHANDFKNYSQKFAIRDGRCIKVPSPLDTIFENGGILFINLSNLSVEEQENYQSLWANPPHWNCKPIHRNTRIIGFLEENLPCTPSFARQAVLTRLAPQPESSSSSIGAEPLSDTPPIAVDLFKDSDWYEQLLGNLVFKGREEADFTEGPLLRAIRLKQPLIIHQPPNDAEFEQLLEQIRLEGRFYFNGAWQIVPPEVSIRIDKNPLTAAPSTAPFKIITDDKEAGDAERHYLHLNNWHSLYKQVVADEKTNHPITVDGHLMAKQPPIFYVTENIPPWKWQRLALFLDKQHPKREYTFQLAPNVSAEINYFPQRQIIAAKPTALAVTELATTLEDRHSCSFSSNDTSHLAKKIQDLCPASQEAFIIDLTPESAPTNLLYKVGTEHSAEGTIQFALKKFALLNALEQGKTVILRGEIPKSLFLALQPLFSAKPYIEYNGERLPIPGRLILVQPTTSAQKTPANCQQLCCDFSLEDYRRELLAATKSERKAQPSKEQARETEIVDKLLLLFQLAPWPHRGNTMPEGLQLCFTKLQNMKQKLLERPASGHRHNPIKGLIMGDYLPDSEEYAFLNVLCKLLFDESEQDPMRVEKYQKLRSRLSDSNGSEYVWRALNTCNGATLKALLGKNWLQEIAKNPPSPEGLIAYWKSNWPRIFKALDQLDQLQREKPLPQPTSTLSTKSSNRSSLRKVWSNFTAASKPKSPEAKTLPPVASQTPSRQLKTKRRLADLLSSTTSPRVIVLKGEPGVGKSHYLNGLAKDVQFDCVQNLESKSTASKTHSRPQLYLADEANTAKPGMLNTWDAAHRGSATLVQGGQSYATPSKFFATTNPEHFAGRFYHEALSSGETLWLQMPSVPELEQWLVDHYKVSPLVASHLIATAELYKTFQAFYGYSFRELHSLMQHFQVLEKRQILPPPEQILFEKYGDFANQLPPAKRQELLKEILEQQIAERCYKAACNQFASAIPEVAEQQKFKDQLRSYLKLPPPSASAKNKAVSVGDKLFPTEMQEAYTGLQQALWIRDHVVAKHRDSKDQIPTYKRGFLLQGASGIGKNELIRAALGNAGFTAGSPSSFDPRHHYLEVNASEENFEEIATLAFNNRMILVVKDLHLLPRKKERFYGDLLMGIVKGQSDERPGFMILSDGNYGGSLSPALCSRMSIHHVPAYSDASWELLAKQRLGSKSHAYAFTQGFWHPKAPHPRKVTGHDFFGCLNRVSTKPGI